MKSLSTWIFVAVVLLLGGYSIYEYKFAKVEDPGDKNKTKVFSTSIEDITAVLIQKVDAPALALQRKGDVWMVMTPVEDLADIQVVASFLGAMLSEKAIVGKTEPITWKDYQLDQPAFVVEVQNSKGQKEKVELSALRAFDGNYFIKRGSQLLIGEKSWDIHLDRDAGSLRDKRIFRDPFNAVKLDVVYNDKALKQKFQIEKTDDGWKIVGKNGGLNMAQYDSAKVDQMVEGIKNLRATDFVSEPAALNSVAFRLDVTGPENKTWWIEFGPEQKGFVYAKSSSINGTIKLMPSLIENIKLSLEDFRNGRLPFQFDLQKVHRVKINTESERMDFSRSDANWVLTKPNDKKEVNQEVLVQFFQRLQGLNAKRFLKSAPASVKYFRSIQLIDAEDREILRVRWGDNAYAATSRSTETLELNPAELSALPLSALIKDKPTDQQPKEVKNGEVTNTN